MLNKKMISFLDYDIKLINCPLSIQFDCVTEISKDSFDDPCDRNLAEVEYDDEFVEIDEENQNIYEKNIDSSFHNHIGNNPFSINKWKNNINKVVINCSGNHIEITTVNKEIKPIHIKVYSDSMQKLNIISSNGNVTLNKGTINHFSLNALHGNVNLNQMILQHNSSISLKNGNLTISYSSLGSFNLKNSNGRISLLSCPMIGGSICSRNGLISIDNSTVSNGTIIDSHNGTIKLSSTNFGSRNNISTHTGTMDIKNSVFGNDVSISSSYGSIIVSHCYFFNDPNISTKKGNIKLIHSESGARTNIISDNGFISYEDCGYDKEEKRLFLSR